MNGAGLRAHPYLCVCATRAARAVLVLGVLWLVAGAMAGSARAATSDGFDFPLGSGNSATEYPITQGYCAIDFSSSPHLGVDWGAGSGTAVRAAANGSVIRALTNPNSTGYGNMVMLRHDLPNGEVWYTLYGHMRDAPSVTTGQVVSRRQQIGVVGQTGTATGNHLHFAVTSSSAIPAGYGNPCPGASGTVDPVGFVNARRNLSGGGGSGSVSRLAAINGCGALYMQTFGVTGWVKQLDCGDARAVSLSGNRMAAINGCGALYMQTFGVTGWVRQLDCNDARAISLSDERLAAINGCGALYMQTFGVTGWVKQLDCGDARAVSLSGNRMAAINGCGALYMQTFGVTGWVRQLDCNDARAVSLPGTSGAVENCPAGQTGIPPNCTTPGGTTGGGTTTPTTTTPTTTTPTTTTPTTTTPTTPGAGTTGTGHRRCVVPKLRGVLARRARRALRRHGCRLGAVKRKRSTRVARGRIIRTRPAAGATRRAGTAITIVISRGH